MALTGLFGNSGGLFSFGQQQERPRFVQPLNISSTLLEASFNSRLLQSALTTRGSQLSSRGDAAIVPPWLEQDDEQPLLREIKELRNLANFVDTDFEAFRQATGSPDRQATFVIFRALERLQTLAEFAGQDSTIDSSLGRLDEQFQKGFEQLRAYIGETNLNQLELFLGDRQVRAETEVRLNRNESDYVGQTIAEDINDVIPGLTGNEEFEIQISKSTSGDTFNIDLSQVSGALTIKNITDYVNSQITSIQARDDQGQLVFDDDGNPVSEYSTRFNFERDSEGDYAFEIVGSAAEQVRLRPIQSAGGNASDPALFISSSVTPVGTDTTTVGRLTKVTGLEGTLDSSTFVSFSGIDLGETELAQLTDGADSDDLDPRIAEIRDRFRAEARETLGIEEEEEDGEEPFTTSITDVDSEFRADADTTANAVVTDSSGNVYVVGASAGSFGTQVNVASESDVYLTKFDTLGNVVYSRLLGSDSESSGFSVTVDDNDNVIVAGQADSALTESDNIEGKDAFVAKYTSAGDEVFRYQLDRASVSSAFSVATDSNGDIFVGGVTRGAISATSGFGGGIRDGLLLKLDGTSGSLLQSNVFGTGSSESVSAIRVASDGNILVASEEGGHAVIRKFDGTDISNELYSKDLGSIGSSGKITSIEENFGLIGVTGITNGIIPNSGDGEDIFGSLSGGQDGFVTFLGDNGTGFDTVTTTIVGTAGNDSVNGVSFADTGEIFITGSVQGSLPGQTRTGATDGFVAEIDNVNLGGLSEIIQFGQSASRTEVTGVTLTNQGESILSVLGLPNGLINEDQELTVQSQTSAAVGDFFEIRVTGERSVKIELEEGDTYDDLKRAINIRLGRFLEVDAIRGGEGERLKIEVRNRNNGEVPDVEIIAGGRGQDLLQHIGLEPGRLLPADRALNINRDDEEERLGGSFALGLEGALNIRSKASARYVQGLLDSAISNIQRAFRSLEPNPFRDAIRDRASAGEGTVSPRTTARIANFQTALNRLQASSQSQPTLSLFT